MLNIDFVTPTTPITFAQYYELLVNADWFHDFSDSMAVSSLGCGREGQLRGIGKRHKFSHYMFNSFIQRRNDAIQDRVVDTRDMKGMYDDFKMTQEGV
jgi:hypothetical protein